MQFTAKHSRAFAGNDVVVTVSADPKECIGMVRVVLDDSSLEEKSLSEATESYTGEFRGAGDAGPGMDHVLVVTAWDGDRQPHSATTQWTDPS